MVDNLSKYHIEILTQCLDKGGQKLYQSRYCIPLIVNESPPEIINKIGTHNLQGFHKYIKIKILESYNKDCTIQNCYICNRNL